MQKHHLKKIICIDGQDLCENDIEFLGSFVVLDVFGIK